MVLYSKKGVSSQRYIPDFGLQHGIKLFCFSVCSLTSIRSLETASVVQSCVPGHKSMLAKLDPKVKPLLAESGLHPTIWLR